MLVAIGLVLAYAACGVLAKIIIFIINMNEEKGKNNNKK